MGRYITTPIYYVNGAPHLGSALSTVCADVLARYYRMRGSDTWFVTGTDENATKCLDAARAAGVPTQQFVDQLAGEFRDAWDHLHIQCDDFIRTTEPRHIRAVQEFFRRLSERGWIYKADYEGWYSVSDETYYSDREVSDGVSLETGKPVERVRESNYFFRLSAFGDRLLRHIDENPGFLQPDFRRNEVIAYIRGGLRDTSVTRPNPGWGIPAPGDPGQVIYVWFDALINYLSAIGWPDDPRWENLWPADVHLMAKEIFVRFHATLWPAMLLALDLPLPRSVYAHGWWTIREGSAEVKAGKSTGGLPHPTEFAAELAAATGASSGVSADATRYLLLREMAFPNDSEFRPESFRARYNTDLANGLGNLGNRTLGMACRYLGGVTPGVADEHLFGPAQQAYHEATAALDGLRFHAALEATAGLIGSVNAYIEHKAPWAMAKDGDPDVPATLGACLEALRVVATLLSPFMPYVAAELRRSIGLGEDGASSRWDSAADWRQIPAGLHLPPANRLFPRIP